jgi:hexosaminidase
MDYLPLVPKPQTLAVLDGELIWSGVVAIELCVEQADDRFAADYLAECLQAEQGVVIGIATNAAHRIRIQRQAGPAESYTLHIDGEGVRITGADAAGVYYATQTLRQCLRRVPGATTWRLPYVAITDRPDLEHRAIHYDTKRHQDTADYVREFIRELAHYKVNILVWEWEDKLAYRCHPDIGAPGAFTIDEMQEFTSYARQHHVEIVPLVQGLGHVSFILKHKKFRSLREIPDSDWEFCPLKDGSYELLFELWRDAMVATPGSHFFHIGSDETYELGEGEACGCAAHARQHGTDSLMRIFIDRCVEWVESQGRTCLSWGGQWKPGTATPPRPTMIWADGDKAEVVKASADAGYPCWIYAPNTGVTPLVVFSLPWVKSTQWNQNRGNPLPGGFAMTASAYSQVIADRSARGSITTSWDDSGLHNQMWMPHFVCGATYSWNGQAGDVDAWFDDFIAVYFGIQARDIRECHALLQDCALFYDDTFQRRVWHWGDIGKIHLPDFPRAGLEYDLFWRKRYALLLRQANEQRIKLDRIDGILAKNLGLDIRHAYDVEVLQSCSRLMRHNVDLILMLGELEARLERASYTLYMKDRRAALAVLRSMEVLLREHLTEREAVYADLVACWERTRLPKGLAVGGRSYFWKPERARHFANRTPDMRYLVVDEDHLDIEGYLERLVRYNDAYEQHEIDV